MMKPKSNQAGMTLVELVVALFIVSLLISAIFVLVRSYHKSSDQVVSDVTTGLYVNNLLQTLSEEMTASGHQPIDSALPTITANGKVLGITYGSNSQVDTITISFDLDANTRQILTYKLVSLLRSPAHPNEKALVKTKQLSDGSNVETVFSDEIVLANIDSLICNPFLNLNPASANAAVKGVDCSLSVYRGKDSNLLSNYKVYANAENQL